MKTIQRRGASCGAWMAVLSAACALLLALTACGRDRQQERLVAVQVDSTPEGGASVMMMGEDRGKTPVVIPGVAPGKYEVVLRKERFRRKIEEIEVTLEGNNVFVIEMAPVVGYVTIESTPHGAEVLLNGNSIGVTPIIYRPLQIGEYSYELRHPDHYPVENSFVLEDNFRLEFKHPLRPLEGELSVFSRPSSARIWLNNVLQMQRTPATFSLRPGIYLVSTYTDEHIQADELVTLAANTTQSVQLNMEPGDVPQGMVLIPAGEFIMGADDRAPDERPARKIHLEAFYIDRFEVTNQEFARVFPEHRFPDGQENFPVLDVSWHQATRYAEAIGKRLPTEAEWEKAARGSDGREYPWGMVFDSSMSNTVESSIGLPTRVGQFHTSMSPYRCMDMAGNAYEWVADWYEAYPGNQYVTKDYGQIFRVLRGGSYLTGRFEARSAARHFDRMDASRRDYGFRCAKDAPS